MEFPPTLRKLTRRASESGPQVTGSALLAAKFQVIQQVCWRGRPKRDSSALDVVSSIENLHLFARRTHDPPLSLKACARPHLRGPCGEVIACGVRDKVKGAEVHVRVR